MLKKQKKRSDRYRRHFQNTVANSCEIDNGEKMIIRMKPPRNLLMGGLQEGNGTWKSISAMSKDGLGFISVELPNSIGQSRPV